MECRFPTQVHLAIDALLNQWPRSRMMRLLLLVALVATETACCDPKIPISGSAIPGMQSVDEAYSAFMERQGIPGGSVAILKEGRLVYARGLGWANAVEKQPVRRETLFRIASISKPLTALAVVTLVEEGKLTYDQKVFPYLDYPTPAYEGAQRDPRLDAITIEHLLQHSGGWDRDTAIDPDGTKSFDPMFYSKAASTDLTGSDQPPASAEQNVRWMIGRPLQFDPGSRYAYSNLGYCVLGRVIEKCTGQPYETYVRSILEKAGITSMRIGRSRASEIFENETHYHSYPSAELGKSVWNEPDTPSPYRFPMSTLDAHGGWVATASDLVRFTTLMDGRANPVDQITAESIAAIHTRPSFAPPAAEKNNYYGMGWSFWEREDGQFRNWFHSGSLPGTMAMLIRSDNGITWAALFNLRPKDSSSAFKDLDATMWKAVRSVTKWPE